MKVCSICKRELPLSAFGKLYSSKDGLQYSCKKCLNKRNREYFANNRDKYHEYYRKREDAKNLLDYNNMCDAIGGYKIYILNHTKNGEYKYNIINTVTREVFKTNDKNEFIKFVEGL